MIDNRILTIATVLLCGGIVALAWFLGISPQLQETSRARAELTQVESLNAQHRAKLVELEAQSQDMSALEAELDAMQRQFPPDADYTTLLTELGSLATANSVTMSSLALDSPTVLPEGNQSMVSVPIALALTGSLDDLQSFVGDLQAAERLVLVTSVTYAESEEAYSLAVSGYIFVLTEGAAVPAVDPAATPAATPVP